MQRLAAENSGLAEPLTESTPIVTIAQGRIGYLVNNEAVIAVAEADLEIRAKERVMLLGPSGCGKSTLLKAVAGYNKLIAGEIVVDGKRTFGPGPDRAVVFQEFDQLFPWRTVLGNVVYPLRRLGRSKKQADSSARHYLSMMGLNHALERHPHQLSGGMKQRVAIARAFAMEPALLLMDEPFASLDAQTRTRLQNELRAMAEKTGVSILFVTHSIEEALVLGTRVVMMSGAPSHVEASIPLDQNELAEPVKRLELTRQLEKMLGLDAKEVETA